MNWAVPCSAYFSKRSASIARASGPYFSKKLFSSFLTRSARSRRVREMAEQVERIGFRLVARHPQQVEVDAALLQL
jgi:hypothetical protein